MKTGLGIRTLLAAALLALVAVPVSAQHCFKGNGTEHSPVMKQMGSEIGAAAAEYWTPKLNDYKIRIDRVVSSEDLDALNKLRVRWAMLMEEGLKKLHAAADVKKGDNQSDAVKMEVNGDGKSFQEVMEIFAAAKEIAARYHGSVGNLQGDVLTDVSGFVGALAERADRFAEANRVAIDKDPEAKQALAKRGELAKCAAGLQSEKTRKDFASIYDFAIEPLVFLYNGADLAGLLAHAGSMAKPITGVELPDVSALRQNFPNPAVSTTKITYKVTEPSRSTVIRLYDKRGELVGTYDQGERAAGEHELDVDVSALASGSYLYHLTLQTANGPRVYSKTMQVVH